MADSDFEFEDDLPDWSDDDDKPKCASAAKERRTEPPLLLTSSDDLLEAVASQLAEEPVAATTALTRQKNVFLSNLGRMFSVIMPLVRLPSSAPLPDCEALADLCVSALWVQAVRCRPPCLWYYARIWKPTCNSSSLTYSRATFSAYYATSWAWAPPTSRRLQRYPSGRLITVNSRKLLSPSGSRTIRSWWSTQDYAHGRKAAPTPLKLP